MSNYVDNLPFLNRLWAAMENMHILEAFSGLCLDNFVSPYSGHN